MVKKERHLQQSQLNGAKKVASMKKKVELSIKPIKKKNLPEKIIEELRNLIESGQIKPGSKLPGERTLSAMLQVSRPSLREALRALNYLGIIENRHGEGTYLTDMTSQIPIEPLGFFLFLNKGSLMDTLEARIGIDSYAAALAAEHRTDKDLDKMRNAMEEAKNAIGEPERFMAIDLDFHRIVSAATQNTIIEKVVNNLCNLFLPVRIVLHRHERRTEYSIDYNYDYHEKIYQHIACKDPIRSSEAMRTHLIYYRNKLANRFKK